MSRAYSKRSEYKLCKRFVTPERKQPVAITFDYIASVKSKSQLIYERRIASSEHYNGRQFKKRSKRMLQNGFSSSAYSYQLNHFLNPAKARF